MYGLTISQATLYSTISTALLILSTPIAGFILKKDLLSRRTVLYAGLTILGISNVFRSGDFGKNSPNFWIWFSMMGLSGIGNALILCCAMPEIVDSLEKQPGLNEQIDQDSRNIRLSTFLVFIGGAANALGMLASLTLTQSIGYTYSFTIWGCLMLSWMLQYAFLCGTENIYQIIPSEDSFG